MIQELQVSASTYVCFEETSDLTDISSYQASLTWYVIWSRLLQSSGSADHLLLSEQEVVVDHHTTAIYCLVNFMLIPLNHYHSTVIPIFRLIINGGANLDFQKGVTQS